MDFFYDNFHFDKFNGENQIDLLSNSFSQIGSDLENKIFDCPIEDFIENKINKGDNTKEIKIISDINNDFHKDEKIRFIIKKKTSKKKKKLKNQKISKFIQGKIEIIKPIKKEEKKIISEKKLIGRKKKDSDEYGEHNKFTDDNLSRKCKRVLLEILFFYINNIIKIVYENNVYEGENEKQLLKLNQSPIINSKADYNREFLNKNLKEIFSNNISTKYTKHSLSHNKDLIQTLLNEKDEQKKILFQKLFNLTFVDCLNHFRGTKKFPELEGMMMLEEACKQFQFDKDFEDYKTEFKYFIMNYEEIIMTKRLRNRSKKVEIDK